MNWQRDIEVLTPLFNRGAYQDTPEIRVPSIRGMVRWWFRQLEYQSLPTDQQQRRQQLLAIRKVEKQLFGGVHDGAVASRLVFRVSNVRAQQANPNLPTLPHKQGGQASPQAAFDPGARFKLEVFSRLGNLPPELETKAKNALEVWLLLGALGLRANRGGGNVWAADGPKTAEELKHTLQNLGLKNWSVALVGQGKGKSVKELHETATDTIQGNLYRDIFGSIKPRLSSPTKFKVIHLVDGFCLLACAPHQEIQCEDGQKRPILREAERLLRNKQQPQRWQALGNWNYILP